MIRVVLESPYAGDVEKNVEYARKCVRDSLMQGESPIASHILHTQPGILEDQNAYERALGIEAGLCWTEVCDRVVVYYDHGISDGMQEGIDRAKKHNKPVVYRLLAGYQVTEADEVDVMSLDPMPLTYNDDMEFGGDE